MKKYLLIILAIAIFTPQISFAQTGGGAGAGGPVFSRSVLGVTNITTVKTSAISDNTYTNGWKWIFDVTVPSGETNLQMKFMDWSNDLATIPAGSNMRFYSTQSINASSSDSAINVAASNTYGDILLLDPSKGQQIQVAVEVKIPTGIAGGAYWTSYGVQTTGSSTTNVPNISLHLSDDTQSTTTFMNDGLSDESDKEQGGTSRKIAKFGIKMKDNTVGWVNGLSFKINSIDGYSPRSLISDIILSCSGICSTLPEWIDDNTVVFAVSGVRLSQSWREFGLYVSSYATSSSFTISATLDADQIEIEDNSGISIDVSGIDDITSNEITYIPPQLSSISMSPLNPEAVIGAAVGDEEIYFHSNPMNQDGYTFATTTIWTTSSSSVGTIDSDGLFTAVSVGTTTITASAGNFSTSTLVTVTGSHFGGLYTSLSNSSPNDKVIIASEGVDSNEAYSQFVFSFNLQASGDDITVHVLTLSATGTAVSNENISAVYLYDGSTMLNATTVGSITGGITFNNLDLVINEGQTMTLRVAVDIKNATTLPKTLKISLDGESSSTISAENSYGYAIPDEELENSAEGSVMTIISDES